ncbi:Protein NARROW LEAF 1 [Linum perenne]
MDRNRLDLRLHHSGSSQSEESALDMERNYCPHSNLPWSSPSSLQPLASGGQHPESNAAYFSWPTLSRFTDTAEDRANYFGNLQKGVLPEILGRLPTGQQATTLLELMTIRAFHSKILRRFSHGTAIGFRIRRGILTDIPAILVFVARKVHRQWLSHVQCLPSALEGPGGVWCDVDVVEFSYFGAPAPTPKEQLYTELVDGVRGGDPSVGSGSQHDEKPRPVGIIWGGTANRGRLKLKIGQPPENWTSGVDLGRLLDLLELDLITTAGGLQGWYFKKL